MRSCSPQLVAGRDSCVTALASVEYGLFSILHRIFHELSNQLASGVAALEGVVPVWRTDVFAMIWNQAAFRGPDPATAPDPAGSAKIRAAAPGSPWRLEATGIASDVRPVARIARRVIRGRNVREPEGEPYGNRTRSGRRDWTRALSMAG